LPPCPTGSLGGGLTLTQLAHGKDRSHLIFLCWQRTQARMRVGFVVEEGVAEEEDIATMTKYGDPRDVSRSLPSRGLSGSQHHSAVDAARARGNLGSGRTGGGNGGTAY